MKNRVKKDSGIYMLCPGWFCPWIQEKETGGSGKSFGRIFLSAFLCAVMLTGCGSALGTEDITASTLSITKEGAVTAWLIESFQEPIDEEYYSAEELEAQIREEIDAFNEEQGYTGEAEKAPVRLTEVKEEQGAEDDSAEDRITVQMKYHSAGDYTKYNGRLLFYGTVAEAYAAGHRVEAQMENASDREKKLSEEEIKAMEQKHILIVEENMNLSVPGEILYVSSGVNVTGKNTAEAAHEAGYSYIIMK